MTQTAKLFPNGRSQAVRLPAEFRFEGQEVYVERVEGGVLLRSKPQTVADWLERFYASSEPGPADFLIDRDQNNIAQERDLFREDA